MERGAARTGYANGAPLCRSAGNQIATSLAALTLQEVQSDARNRIRACNGGRSKCAGIVWSRRLLARRQLSVGRPDLSARQSTPQEAAAIRAREATTVGALGNDAGTQFHLLSPEPDHQGS